ncbi:MAG: SIS domain-containing protein [Saprospiraceae bacterium]|nr:SIS domain-containing protein [Saprospiraceae bacterium]
MEDIRKIIQDSIDVKRKVLNSDIPAQLKAMAEEVTGKMKNNGKLLICGNGGSAADAQHIAAELSVRFKKERGAIPALALGTNFSHLTAAANDYGFDYVFSRQIEGIGKENDVLLVLSTSGNSVNILEAVKKAQELEMTIYGWTGASGGQLAGKLDQLVRVPSKDTARIQECHILLGHILCGLIEEKWAPNT